MDVDPKLLTYYDLPFWLILTIVFSLALASAWFVKQNTTDVSMGWYGALLKCPSAPPPWVPTIVWLVFYFLLALILYIGSYLDPIPGVFGTLGSITLFLTVIWTFVFFELDDVLGSIITLTFISVLVIVQILYLFIIIQTKFGRLCAGILILFLAWVVYTLGLTIWAYLHV